MVFKNETQYGIASFFQNDFSEDVNLEMAYVPETYAPMKAGYTQIKGRDKCFIGVFITDEALVSTNEIVRVIFADAVEGQPFAIEVTLNSDNAFIISYECENDPRKIEKISFSDKNRHELYEIE